MRDKNFLQLFLVFSLCSYIFMIPEAFALATKADPISNVLCSIVIKLTGPVGKGISTIAIIVLGVGLFLGKLSWAVAVATAIGIGLIFGAEQMVRWLATAGAGTAIIDDKFCSS